MINKKHKKVSAILNTKQFLNLASASIGCVSISPFASLLGILREITSLSTGLKVCAVSAGIKTYGPLIKKKKKAKWNGMLAKSTLNNIKVLISKALTDSYISCDDFFFSKWCVIRSWW